MIAMRRRGLLAMVPWAAILILCSSGWGADEVGLVAHYSFESADGVRCPDDSGNGNESRLIDAKVVSGEFGGALKLGGAESFLDCGVRPALDTESAGTIAFWCNPEKLQGGMFGRFTGGNWPEHRLTIGIANYDGVIKGWGRPMMVVAMSDGKKHWHRMYGPPALNTWTHIAVTFDGEKVTVYRNAELVESVAQEVKPEVTGIPLVIGRSAGLGNPQFEGMIDGVKVYNRALTREEVKGTMKRKILPASARRTVRVPRPKAGANLVKNAGFEKADPEDKSRPAGFRPGHAGKVGKASLTWESPGRRSKRCVAVETTNSDDIGYWETVVPVNPRKQYVVSFIYKCRSASAGKGGDPRYESGRAGGPNLELGVVPRYAAQAGKPTNWTDIGIALGPVGGTYAPMATEWTPFRQIVTTNPGQTEMKVKLRVFCYKQKVWFDDLSVVETGGTAEGQPAAVEQKKGVWVEADTTPPAVFRPEPLPNASAGARPNIAVRLSGKGSARVRLDGKDISRKATVTEQGITLRPARPLKKGRHVIEIEVSDQADNLSNRLAWQFGVGETLTNRLEIKGKRYVLNGRPFFPVGIYSYQLHPADGRFNETALAQAADAGFNCVLNTLETREGLDKHFKHGMMGFLNISLDMKGCTDAAAARVALMEKGHGRFAKHPCALGYWADDPEHLPKPAEMSKYAYEVLRREDPDHPVFYAMSDMTLWKTCIANCDSLVSYRYPVPQYHPQMIYGWTLNAAFAVAGDKPVLFNSQAVDLGYGAALKSREGFRPTPVEMRAMAYHSLTHDIAGWSLYANAMTEKDTPEHWREALKMATEIRYLAPVLAAGKSSRTVSLKADTMAGSIYFRELAHEGAHTLIAANVSAGRVATTWEFKKPTWAIALFEDRVMRKPSTEVQDVFEPFEVHVYRW